MTRVRLRRLLGPLVAVSSAAGLRHCSVIGSALAKEIDAVGDLDVYVVVEKMTAANWNLLIAAAADVTGRLAELTDRGWRVETFRAPVSPSPRASTRQLHLLIDDHASISIIPRLLLWKYASSGMLLSGAPIEGLTPLTRRTLRDSAAGDAARALRAALRSVARRQILGLAWTLSPRPRLRRQALDVRTRWHYRCLLKGAVSAGDGMFGGAAALLGHRHPLQPMALRFADTLTDWQEIKPRWPAIAREVSSALRARIRLLGEIT
jgi:hypothetical protein